MSSAGAWRSTATSSRAACCGSAIPWSCSSLFPAELGRERHPLVDPEVKLPERPARGVPVARRRLGDVVAGDLDDLLSGLGRHAVGERHVEAEHCLLRRNSDVLDDLAIVNTADAQLIPR